MVVPRFHLSLLHFLFLLCSEELVVDHENTVLVLANLWVMRGQGVHADKEDLTQVASTVRLMALSSSYLCGVLPNIKWVSGLPVLGAILSSINL